MTQLEKNDPPVNHYVNNKEILKMVDNNASSSSSSSNCIPSTSTSPAVAVMNSDVSAKVNGHCNGEAEEDTSAQEEVNMNGVIGADVGDVDIDIDEGIEMGEEFSSQTPPVGPHCSSNVRKLSSPTPIVINKVAGPIPLPPPTSLSIGGNAYGGNRSYGGMAETDLPKFGSNERPSSPRVIYDYSGASGSGFSGANISKMPGVVGFGNLGNTCFMNSGLQSLLNTPPVVEFFLKSPTIQDDSLQNGMLTESFQNLIRNAWLGPSSVIHPREFKDTLGNIFTQFKDCRQHDCQEFLALTLDVLHEQLKIWNDLKRGNGNEINSSGYASGPIESATGSGTESVSTANDSDVSSSLQSPGSGSSGGDADNSVQFDGILNVKKRRLTDDSEVTSTPLSAVGADKEKLIVKKGESSTSENLSDPLVLANVPSTGTDAPDPLLMQIDENDELLDVDAELDEVDMLLDEEDEVGREKLALKRKAKKAEGFWMNYIRDNNTVIASSFQGMYKSTMTCDVCSYVSCIFEPFMYLSLPIPRPMDREFDVMFSSTKDYQITKVNVTLNINDNVGILKDKVVEKMYSEIQLSVPPSSNFIVVEVVNYHIFSILKDDQPLKNVKNGIHDVYVLELNQNFNDLTNGVDIMGDVTGSSECYSSFSTQALLRPSTYLDEDWENDVSTQTLGPSVPSIGGGFIPASNSEMTNGGDDTTVADTEMNGETEDACRQDGSNSECEDLISCSVCLEELPKSKLKQHYGCSCILCSECISKTAECLSSCNETVTSETAAAAAKSVETRLKCPVCSEIVDYKQSFVPLAGGGDGCKKLNLIPVLFYYRSNSDTNNNASILTTPNKFIGHPLLVQLPSTLPASEFYDFISTIVPFSQSDHPYAVKNACWTGKECGACIYNRSCTGCEFRKDGNISINSRNSILISYSDLSADLISLIEPPNMATCTNPYSAWPSSNCYKEEPLIDIYDCMDTFSQIEYMDEQNPWYCSQCKKKQCATKSLTICRFPDYLIVYLKRFVFVDHSSNKLNNKLIFPIETFDVSKYIAEEFAGGEHIYDLYSCVCHFGSANGGHYTSYSKNPKSDAWHYFNDDSVSNKCPSKEEFGSGYILFYAKKGLKSDIPLKRMMNSRPQNFSTSPPQDAVDSSLKVSSDCDTTSPVPDCSMEIEGVGTYGNPIGPVNSDACISSNQQEDIISSTTDYSSSSRTPAFAHRNNILDECSSVSATVSSADKVNRVRENVSNLCIDVNRRKRLAGTSSSSSATTNKGVTATSTSTSTGSGVVGTSQFDDFDSEFNDETIKPYAEFSIENKRLTKIAQRSKFSPNSQAPGPRKQL